MIYWVAGIGLLFGISVTGDINMIYWIAGIGLMFGLFVVFIMKMALDGFDDETDDDL